MPRPDVRSAALCGQPRRRAATRARRLRALKSLLSFAAKLGYLPFNVGAALRGPKLEQKLAERILSERQVFAVLEAVAEQPRDHALIRLLYNGGLRVSELVTLRWRNLIDGVANVTGKGGKTRVVRLSRGTWDELQALRTADSLGEDFLFAMSAVNAWKRVKVPVGSPGSPTFRSRRTSYATPTAPMPCAAERISRPSRGTPRHASIARTSRYLHARPEKSSGDCLTL